MNSDTLKVFVIFILFVIINKEMNNKYKHL